MIPVRSFLDFLGVAVKICTNRTLNQKPHPRKWDPGSHVPIFGQSNGLRIAMCYTDTQLLTPLGDENEMPDTNLRSSENGDENEMLGTDLCSSGNYVRVLRRRRLRFSILGSMV